MYDNSSMIREILTPFTVQRLQKELATQKSQYESLINKYKYMLEHQRMTIKSMEYYENREAQRLRKENIKLRKSLRKLYEKYIKPTQESPESIKIKDTQQASTKAYVDGIMEAQNKPSLVLKESERDKSTTVLFVNYQNGFAYRYPVKTLVKINGVVTEQDLKAAELQQLAASRMGGSWRKMMQTLNLEYEILQESTVTNITGSWDIRYDLITGNY